MRYTIEKAKKQNLAAAIAMIPADSGRGLKHVAPYGGAKARLGTNPICFVIPSNQDGPLVFDMATSAAADSKVSNDPSVLKAGGALLPLGGTEGYKGTGLAAIVEILSGLLTGFGFCFEPAWRHNDGCFIAAFRELETCKREVTEFAEYLKARPPARGLTEVFYPGEIEYRKEQDRRKNSVPIEDATWEKLRELVQGYRLADKLGL